MCDIYKHHSPENQNHSVAMEGSGAAAVVMVPIPAQGHLNQLLHLARIISERGVPVHYIGSATHNRQAKERVHGWDISAAANIYFRDFQLPEMSITPPPPDPLEKNNFPKHLLPTFDHVVLHFRQPLGVLLRELSSSHRRVVVVFDSLMSFAAHEASFVSNAEAYCFDACSAFSILHFKWEAHGKPLDEEGSLLPKDIPRISFEDCFTEGFIEFVVRNTQWVDYRSGVIYNTCIDMEGRFLSMLAQQQPDKKIWAIGPLNPVTFYSTEGSPHKCLEWLDKQPPSSVLYVSFGTMTSISDDQIAEVATALERSEQRFIWVVRDADRGDIYNGEVRKIQLPDGFEERVKGVGIVVRDWAPQLLILAHSSTGGFMSHCGWNSCMESLSMGVPIAAWPMHSDQPRNALFLTEVLEVGFLVRGWERRDELISADAIECCVKNLMATEKGDAMRKRAKEVGKELCQAVSDGGTSIAQLESFLAHINR